MSRPSKVSDLCDECTGRQSPSSVYVVVQHEYSRANCKWSYRCDELLSGTMSTRTSFSNGTPTRGWEYFVAIAMWRQAIAGPAAIRDHDELRYYIPTIDDDAMSVYPYLYVHYIHLHIC